MKTSIYVSRIMKDFFVACGCLFIITEIILAMSVTQTIHSSLLWQITLAASAFISFKYALIDTPELSKKAQQVSFYVFFLLADVFIIVWLWFFSTGQLIEKGILIPFVIIILIVKLTVYTMLYVDGRKEAKLLNEKLSAYGKEDETDQ